MRNCFCLSPPYHTPSALSRSSNAQDPRCARKGAEREGEGEGGSTMETVVLDAGSFRTRVGLLQPDVGLTYGPDDASCSFHSVVTRARMREDTGAAPGATTSGGQAPANETNEEDENTDGVRTVVGDLDRSSRAAKVFDISRSQHYRTPFESDVVYNFDLLESVYDMAFHRLFCAQPKGAGTARGGAAGVISIEDGIEGRSMGSMRLMMTECLGNPSISRASHYELLFEAYGVGEVACVADPHAAIAERLGAGMGGSGVKEARAAMAGCLQVHLGHSCSYLTPWVDGRPVVAHTSRLGVGGAALSQHLSRLLMLRYPQHRQALGLTAGLDIRPQNVARRMRESLCYVADDYREELRSIREEMDRRAAAAASGGDDDGVALVITSDLRDETVSDGTRRDRKSVV